MNRCRENDRHLNVVVEKERVIGIALSSKARVNTREIGRREKLSLLRGNGQVDGSRLPIPHPGGKRFRNLAGGPDQVLEVTQRYGPAKRPYRRWSVFARLFDRFRIRPSRCFRRIGDGFQANRQIQRRSKRGGAHPAVKSDALPVIRNNISMS